MENRKAILAAGLILAITLLFGCTDQTNTSNDLNNGGLNETAGVAGNNGSQKETADLNQMVDCGKMEDPFCFVDRMNQCLPVTAEMISSDGLTNIEITVLGQINETCHFQRKLNGVLNLDCYFPKGTMNMDTLDQTFGNDKGLQKVVDDACKTPGW